MANKEGTIPLRLSITTFIVWLVVYQFAFALLLHIGVSMESGTVTALIDPVLILASLVYIQFWYPLALLVALPVMVLQLLRRRSRLWVLAASALAIIAAWRVGVAFADLSMPVAGAVVSSAGLFTLNAIHIWRALS